MNENILIDAQILIYNFNYDNINQLRKMTLDDLFDCIMKKVTWRS